jgi:epoxyqueuosine reductase
MPVKRLLSRLSVSRLPPGTAPYEVDPAVYARFDQRNNMTVGRPNWDERVQAFMRRNPDTRARRIQAGRPGYGLADYSLFLSAGTVAERLGTAINTSNRGLTAWRSLGVEPTPGVTPWQGSPAAATAMVKRVARFYGADLAGIAPLDPRWLYSHAFWPDGAHKEIVIAPAEAPAETEQQLVIPQTMRWVIVMGMHMNPGMLSYTPSPVGCAETHATYSRMALLVACVAEFLRGIGWQAIPALNDLAASIPLAIDAGFGEQGRNGKLITPEFGPAVRLCKILTDLPLERDHPIRFGVKRFCESCRKCADACPARAIPAGEPTWSGPNLSNNPGVRAWHLDHEACRRYWALGPADNCTVCLRACPFTKGRGPIHDLVRAAISRVPRLNPVWRRLDDWLGYGRERGAGEFWRG